MKPVKTLIVPQRLIDKGMNSQTFLADEGIEIFSFGELRDYVSELSCLYPDSILYFRGQHTDHKRKSKKFGEASTFLPSLYRGNPGKVELNRRWGNLEAARQILTQKLEEYPGGKNKEFDFLKAKRLAQWSVIQHYEIAFTPLLDVTQSLRVACSFALDGLSVSQEYAYVYVFALPYPTGRITVNSEHYLTLIRLLSVSPSEIRRPHNQEGFLVGEDDISPTEKVLERFDLRGRAIAKFKIFIRDNNFWTTADGVRDRCLTHDELYPISHSNSFERVLEDLKLEFKYSRDTTTYDVETFLSNWSDIERLILGFCREMTHDFSATVVKGIKAIIKDEQKRGIPTSQRISYSINELRKERNNLVHKGPTSVNIPKLVLLSIDVLKGLRDTYPQIDTMADIYEKYHNS